MSSLLLCDCIALQYKYYISHAKEFVWELGVGAIKEMPVLYKQNFKFDTAGIYTFEIGHGMRTDELQGITEIGIRIAQRP